MTGRRAPHRRPPFCSLQNRKNMNRVIVIGGGAAGMMAAWAAAAGGSRVLLLEKNEKTGKKIYITGKGRCNFTNACPMDEMMGRVLRNGRFLYSAFAAFSNQDMADFLTQNGCPVCTERGGRMFPASEKASDVTAALMRALHRAGVDIRLHTEVHQILTEDGSVAGVQINREKIPANAVIIATGGLSYPLTGSTGDGYRFARETGHSVTECLPSLVSFRCAEDWVRDLEGLSLKNISIDIRDGRKKIFSEFGEMLFTHFGVSGPVILSASSAAAERLQKAGKLNLWIDCKPALTEEQLDARILRDFSAETRKQFKNALGGLLPARMTGVMVRLSGIDPEKTVNNVTREERLRLVRLLKALPLTVTGTGGFSEAVITRGGVSVKDVNPSTMESRRIAGLYFAGEVLDVDALTGGYNLQIAWSTGVLAGKSAAGAGTADKADSSARREES